MSMASDAQLWKSRRYEVSAGIGTTQFFGDIGGFSKDKNVLGLKDIIFRQTRVNLTTAMKYRILDNVSARFNMAFGYFHSTDAKGSNEARGYESGTLFFEPSLIGEYYFIKNNFESSFLLMKGRRSAFKSFLSRLDVYSFSGFGGILYKVNPNAVLAPEVIKTAGFAPVIPGGVGVNMVYTGNMSFGLELGGRYVFSDNIDGYTSEFSKANDIYYFLNLSFIYKLKTGRNGLPSFRRRS
jgi:hypothetical protein